LGDCRSGTAALALAGHACFTSWRYRASIGYRGSVLKRAVSAPVTAVERYVGVDGFALPARPIHAASLSAWIASTTAIRWPIQRITGTAIELPSAL
jgi:hypothetical protein